MEPMSEQTRPDAPRPAGPPAFNVPGIVLATILLLVAVHVLGTQILDEAGELRLFVDFAFIAGCYERTVELCGFRSAGAAYWSPFTHAALHGDWTHLGANALWLLAFGTPVARRIGAPRFVLFALLGAGAGAALFYVMNPHLLAPMIGASGVVSAVMGAASRFALAHLGRYGAQDWVRSRRLPVLECLTNRTVLFFVGLFFAMNLLIGSGIGSAFGADLQIAWEAHLGGFAFGFLAFALFDRQKRRGPFG